MKKLILFAAVLTLGIVSCSKDDDNTPASELIGKWEFAQEGSIYMSQEILEPYDHEDGCTKDFLMFTASTVADHYFYGDDCMEEIEVDSYIRNGNLIHIMMNGEVESVEIITLDNSTLKLKVTENFDGQTHYYVSILTRKE